MLTGLSEDGGVGPGASREEHRTGSGGRDGEDPEHVERR
jgi:hypothetical protein